MSRIVLDEVASYVQPAVFGLLRVVLPPGYFRGSYCCSAGGGEIVLRDIDRACLVVYRDDVLQRRIGEGGLDCAVCGIAVGGDAIFVSQDRDVVVYPRAGGTRLRRFRYASADGNSSHGNVAAYGGLVYVGTSHIGVFSEDGVAVAHFGDTRLRALCADAERLFVVGPSDVAVFRAGDWALERRFGVLRDPRGACVSDGLLFVCDGAQVLVFDVATGDVVATLGGFAEWPNGVALREDGTLFATDGHVLSVCRLYAAPLA